MGDVRRALPLFSLLGLCACTPSGEVSMPRIVDTALEVAHVRPADLWDTPAADNGYRALARRDGLARGVEFQAGGERLTLLSHRWSDDRRSIRAEWSDSFEAGLALCAVAAARTDELYVAGLDAAGTLRIERWSLAEDAEALATRIRRRELVFEAPASPGVRLLAADPDSRFLLALESSGTSLWQIPLGAGAEAPLRFTAAEFPALRDAGLLMVAEHLTAGRVFSFESTATGERALFLDRDLDGAFDRFEHLDPAAWAKSEFNGSVWLDEALHSAR